MKWLMNGIIGIIASLYLFDFSKFSSQGKTHDYRLSTIKSDDAHLSVLVAGKIKNAHRQW